MVTLELSYGIKRDDLSSDVQTYMNVAEQIKENYHKSVELKFKVYPGSVLFEMKNKFLDKISGLEMAVYDCVMKLGDPVYASEADLEFIARAKARFSEED